MKLTNIKIEKLKPETKPKKYFDGDGLYLLVATNGTKSWRFKYRYLNKERLLAFGTFPEVTLAEARDKRYNARQLLRNGTDPNSEKKEQQRIAVYNASNTFYALAKEWYNINKDNWTKRHAQKVWNWFESYVFPVIGNKPIAEVSGLEILNDIIRKIENDGKTETAHKLLQKCSAVFRLAFITQRVKFNPLADLRGILKPHRTKHYPSIRINELKEFMNRLSASNTPQLYKLAIKMLLLTFVRQGELRKTKWQYIDFEKRMWVIPADLMKTRQEHIVPLSHQVIETLKAIKAISGENDYLFPAKNIIKYPYMNVNVINDVIKGIGYKDKMVAHGFRSLASTTLNELGIAPDIIEKQLAHSEQNKVRAAYNRAEYLPQRIELMQKWADYIDSTII